MIGWFKLDSDDAVNASEPLPVWTNKRVRQNKRGLTAACAFQPNAISDFVSRMAP